MKKNKMIDKKKITKANKALQPFGLQITGGSIEEEAGVARVGLDARYSSDCSRRRISRILMGIFETNAIVIDGIKYEKN